MWYDALNPGNWGEIVSDWYTSPPNNSFDYFSKEFLREQPYIGAFFRASDNQRRMEDYLRNRGLDWSDIRYNSSPFGPSFGSAFAQSSKAILGLYKSSR